MDFMVWASGHFLDPRWIYALGLLVIFLALYLIKPKPRYQVMPSLMFLFKDLGRNRQSNFLRRLITNLLFFIQLLLLLAIILSISKPYINVSKEALFKNTVIVLDTSASMNAIYDGNSRFDEAKDIAADNVGSVNTLILVKKTPEAVLVDESAGKVRDYISKLEPTDNPTNLYSAISAAGGYAKSDSRIVVISDFIDSETDTDLNSIKKSLEAQGIKVDFIQLFSNVKNVGIIDLSISEAKTTAIIKNYNSEEAEVSVEINNVQDSLKIAPFSREVFTFETPAEASKLEITSKNDEFKGDNVAYISAPSDVKKKVLLITNNLNYQRTYIYNALDVMNNVELTVAIPPKIPDLTKFDVFVFKEVNPNLILPGSVKGVRSEVEDGKAAIIFAQPEYFDYQNMLALNLNEITKTQTNIVARGSDSLTNNIEFGSTKKYYAAKSQEAKPIVSIAVNDDNTPLVTFNSYGSGKVIYYGLFDEDKEAETFFGKSPSYFVFWKRAVDFATNTPSIKNLNYKTGTILSLTEEQKIKTPSGTKTVKSLTLDSAGHYVLKDRTIAANIIDERESDISKAGSLDESTGAQNAERFKEKVPFELTEYLIYAALILLLLEILYIKFRGDF